MFHFRSQWFFAALFLKYKIYCIYIYLHVTHSEVLVISIFSSPYRLLLSPYLISNHTIYILLQSTVISLIMADKHFCIRGGTHHNRKEWDSEGKWARRNKLCMYPKTFIYHVALRYSAIVTVISNPVRIDLKLSRQLIYFLPME